MFGMSRGPFSAHNLNAIGRRMSQAMTEAMAGWHSLLVKSIMHLRPSRLRARHGCSLLRTSVLPVMNAVSSQAPKA